MITSPRLPRRSSAVLEVAASQHPARDLLSDFARVVQAFSNSPAIHGDLLLAHSCFLGVGRMRDGREHGGTVSLLPFRLVAAGLRAPLGTTTLDRLRLFCVLAVVRQLLFVAHSDLLRE